MAKTQSAKLTEQLRSIIHQDLKALSPTVYPKIHSRILNEAGYKEMEKTIIGMVLKTRLTPSGCIAQLESDFI